MSAEGLAAMIAGHAVLGACLLAMAEKLLPLLPSSALLVLLGVTTITGPGDFALMLIATTIGSTLGCMCLYALGRSWGEARCTAFICGYGKHLLIGKARYDRLVERYRRHEFRVTLLGQTIPTARACLPLPAGVFHMALGRFVLAVVIGAAVWNGGFLMIGFAMRGPI